MDVSAFSLVQGLDVLLDGLHHIIFPLSLAIVVHYLDTALQSKGFQSIRSLDIPVIVNIGHNLERDSGTAGDGGDSGGVDGE
jgi:hypothetical protein